MSARFLSLSLIAGLALCLSASRLPAPPLPAGTKTGLGALDKYLIDDVTLVGVANIKTIAASPMHKKLQKEVAAVAEHEFFNKHVKQFGVKPVQDIERIVLVMGESKVRERNFNEKGRPENEERMYFLFQGKFDEKKFDAGFAQLAKDHKEVKLHGKGRATILEARGDFFLSLIDKATFVFAPSKKIIEEVQARGTGKVKAKFKQKEFPAALKDLKAETAIDAVGFGPMQVSSKFEQMGMMGYKITPITLDQIGFKKLTVRVEGKNELKGKVVFDAKGKSGFKENAQKITDGLEEVKKRMEQRPGRDPIEQAFAKIFKAVKAKTADEKLTFEGELSQDDAKAVLEAMKKELDREGRGPGAPAP
jgi:hypothetical protein